MVGRSVRPIAELAVAMNIDQNKDQSEIVVRTMLADGWTPDRIIDACRYARNDRDVLKTIQYSGAITPLTLIEAEHQKWEKDHPVIGKCYTPYCGGKARIRAWGEAYCEGCYTRHKEESDARRARR